MKSTGAILLATAVTILAFESPGAGAAPGDAAGAPAGQGKASPAAPAASVSSADTPEGLKTLFVEGHLDEAEAGANRLLSARPDDPDARVILANIFRQRALDKRGAVQSSPDPELAEREEAALFDRALQELELAVKADSSRRDIWLGLCQIGGESGNPQALAATVERAAARFPNDEPFATALRESARPFIEAGDYENAAAVLDGIAKHNPESLPTLIAAGRSLYLAGRRAEGIARLDQAIQQRANDAEAHSQRAELAALDGDFQTAAAHFARAANLDPFRYTAWLGNAAALHAFDPVSALRSVRIAQNRFKNQAQNRTMQDALAVSIINDLRSLLEMPGPSPLDILRVARVMAGAEYDAAAVAELSVLLRRDRGMVEAHALMAEIRSRLGQKKQAAEEMKEALASMDRQPGRSFGVTRDELLAGLGAAEAALGAWAESADAYRGTSDPNRYAYEIGLAWDRLGRYKDAAKQFERVIETGADPAKVADARRRLASAAYRKAG